MSAPSDRKPGVGFPGAPGGPDPGAGVGPGDCTCQKPGAGGFLLWKPRGFRGGLFNRFLSKKMENYSENFNIFFEKFDI